MIFCTSQKCGPLEIAGPVLQHP